MSLVAVHGGDEFGAALFFFFVALPLLVVAGVFTLTAFIITLAMRAGIRAGRPSAVPVAFGGVAVGFAVLGIGLILVVSDAIPFEYAVPVILNAGLAVASLVVAISDRRECIRVRATDAPADHSVPGRSHHPGDFEPR